MKIGIFGGTFDPVHFGHLILAEQCREQCQLDEVWFVPAAVPPHKSTSRISPARCRCDMVQFAISGHAAFRLSTIEIDRPGPSYTVTTLEQLKSEDDSRELFLLIGADSLRDLPLWRQPDRILELATVVAVNRGQPAPIDWSALRSISNGLAESKIISIAMPGVDFSSTDIRKRVSENRSIRYLLPRAVEVYIDENRLYRGETGQKQDG